MVGAVGTSLGSFFVKLGLDASGLDRGIGAAKLAIGSIVGVTAAAAGTLAVFAGRVLNTAERVSLLSKETGFSVETIQAIEVALTQAGRSGDGAAAAFNSVATAVGTIRAGLRGGKLFQQAFDLIGVDPNEGSPEDVFRRIVEALARMEDQSLRTTLAQKLLGSEGAALVEVIGAGEDAVDRLTAKYAAMGKVLSEDQVRELSRVEDAMDDFMTRLSGIGEQAGAQFVRSAAGDVEDIEQATNRLADKLESVVLPLAREIGEIVDTTLLPALELASDLLNGNTAATNWIADFLTPFAAKNRGVSFDEQRRLGEGITQAHYDAIKDAVNQGKFVSPQRWGYIDAKRDSSEIAWSTQGFGMGMGMN